MLYGDNLLTNTVADWAVINGSISEESIMLSSNGQATQNIDITKLSSIPSSFLLTVTASAYTDDYAPTIWAILRVIDTDGNLYLYKFAIINTGSSSTGIELPSTTASPASIEFIFITDTPITFTSWGLFPPKSSEVDLTEVIDKIPRLLSDYNYSSVEVGQVEDIIALISAYITETTEMTGRITLSYSASVDCILTIRIKDNDISELYTPMLIPIKAGFGTIGIPHAYLIRLKGYHTFTVTAQVSAGTLAISTRQVFYVIDGGRLAYNVLDVGSIVYDLSVRRIATDTQISYIYAICIDDGICLIKRCEYSDTPGAAWVSIASIGAAIDAAIEFDGTWDLSTNPYIFMTDSDPYIGWVTAENILYIKKLNDESSQFIASTGVTNVCSIKGWNNVYTDGYDHGLLFIYIKTDGLVYYRGYCKQLDGTYTWETERVLSVFTGTAVDVTAFKTNDFRVGIIVLDNTGTSHIYLTYRNYAGMSFKAESIHGTILEPTVTLYPVAELNAYSANEYISGTIEEATLDLCPPSFTLASIVVVAADVVDTHTIIVTFNYSLINVLGQEAAFSIDGYTITSISVGDTNAKIVFTIAETLDTMGTYTIQYTSTYTGIRVYVTSYCKPLLPTKTIIAVGNSPTHTEHITAQITAPTIDFLPLVYKEGYDINTAYISGTILTPTISLLQVGPNPL